MNLLFYIAKISWNWLQKTFDFTPYPFLDELVAARSLAFNPSGTKLLAGLKNQIRIFDVSVPGRDCDTIKTFDKKEGGQAGIISCITVSFLMQI